MSRKLFLTTRDPYNSNYCTPEGQVLYKATSPYKSVGRTAAIDKVIPNTNGGTLDMQDHFERIGFIEYHSSAPSVITYGGVSKEVTSFFKKGRFKITSLGSDRIFTGPDGNEYRWAMTNTKVVLYTNDKTKTHVAKFNQANFFPSSDPEKGRANLEIYPAGEHMVDIIIVTLAYIEKLRRDRESVVGAT